MASNRNMKLSNVGKEKLDLLLAHLDCDRPLGLKLAFAKGLAKSNGRPNPKLDYSNGKWSIPDNVIRDEDYLLFKHLIINEVESILSEDEINDLMLMYIELGLEVIQEEINDLTSLEDYRIKILN